MQLREYWQQSKSFWHSLLFVLPLWLIYEILAYQLNQGWGGQIRTGIDFFLKDILISAHFPGWVAIILPLVVPIVYLLRTKKNVEIRHIRVGYFVIMFLECLVYGVALGILASSLTAIFLAISFDGSGRVMLSKLVVNLGSGPFEEFVFRLGLLSGLAYLLQRSLIRRREMALTVALIVGALCFSAYHYLSIFEEPFNTTTFLFRFFAGILFGIIFVFRGFGIAAVSHSLYNTFLMFRSG